MIVSLHQLKHQVRIGMNNKGRVMLVLFLLFILIGMSVVVYGLYFMDSTSSPSMVLTGRIFINDQPASSRIVVTVVLFPSGVSMDVKTNDTGFFQVNLSDCADQTALFQGRIQQTMYPGLNDQGKLINLSISEYHDEILQVFIFTVDDSDQEDDEASDSDEEIDDDGKDSGGDDSAEESDGDENKKDDEGESNGSNGSNNGGGNEGNDETDDDESDDDSDAEESSNETDDDLIDPFLSVKKEVSHGNQLWNSSAIVDFDELVQIRITVQYHAEPGSVVEIVDDLPMGMQYLGNTSTNESISNNWYDLMNHSVRWKVSNVSGLNTTSVFFYNASVMTRESLHSVVSVSLLKNDSVICEALDDILIQVTGDIDLTFSMRSDDQQDWMNHSSVEIGEIIRFNCSMKYNGSHQLTMIHLIDQLPDGLVFMGNLTVKGTGSLVNMTQKNQTVIWVFDSFDAFEWCFIEFDVNVTMNGTVTNTLELKANESLGTMFHLFRSGEIKGMLPQVLICEKMVRNETSSWMKLINVTIGDNLSFKITIYPPEMESISGLMITDLLPEGLQYIVNSSQYLYKDQVVLKEPVYDDSDRTLVWNESNQVFDAPLTILYKTKVLNEGKLVNNVTFDSFLCCGGNENYTGTDETVIRSFSLPEELSVDLIVSDPVFVDEYIQLQALVSGGQAPYIVSWDLDNDTIFEITNTSSVVHRWNQVGSYPVTVHVRDNQSMNCTVTEMITVDIEPLLIDSGGPYSVQLGEWVHFDGYATGGVGSYQWYWEFGDGSSATSSNPSHLYFSAGTYQVSVLVTDELETTVQENTTVEIIPPDTIPPMITLNAPSHFIYLRGKALLPFFTPLVFGPVEIQWSAIDNDSTVDYIELFINHQRVKTSPGNVGNYSWDEFVFGKQSIILRAFDSAGNMKIEEFVLWKFF